MATEPNEKEATRYFKEGDGWNSIAALNQTSSFYDLAASYLPVSEEREMVARDLARRCRELAQDLIKFNKVNP